MDPKVIVNNIKLKEAGSPDPITWFYMDGAGNTLMNIGFGFHYNTWNEYQVLFNIYHVVFSWADSRNSKVLTMEDVEKDYKEVKLHKAGKNAAEKIAKTRADMASLNRIFDDKIIKFEDAAREWYNNNTDVFHMVPMPMLIFPNFDGLPPAARFALIDMFYNAGPGTMKQFHRLKASLKMGNWKLAALNARFKEVEGQGGIKIRNDERTQLLLSIGSPVKTEFTVPEMNSRMIMY